MEKGAAKRDEEDGRSMDDRISELPQHISHRILSLLPQKQAVRACVLSRTWRHLVSTRPKIELSDGWFERDEGKETIHSVLERTLQRYQDQNLSIQEFELHSFRYDVVSQLIPLLEKWVPIILRGVEVFVLSLGWSATFSLTSALFESKSLRELYLGGCNISNNVVDKVLFRHLQKLSLNRVNISDEAFEKIMSSCPLIDHLVLDMCEGLQTIKLTKAHYLKVCSLFPSRGDYWHSIEMDAPSIERIAIFDCPNWIHHPDMYFPRLKSLHLFNVRLSNESIDKFSTNLPCLEDLSLSLFSDSEQFKLSSRSIKHLTIAVEGPFLKAAIIDAPNILCFDFECEFLPSISLTTTSTDWKSIVRVSSELDFHNGASSWFHRLSEICKALSTSQISFHIDGIPNVVPQTFGFLYQQPFVIENLSVKEDSYSSVPDFLNCLFRNFRPRNIRQIWYATSGYYETENQLIELLCKILMFESERAHYFGQQNLEDVKMEASYENEEEEEWRGVEGTSSLSDEFALPWDKLKIRFRLKWIE